jgi:hypothetical protein
VTDLPGTLSPVVVTVPSDGPYLIVMRDDTAYCVHELSKRLVGSSQVSRQ